VNTAADEYHPTLRGDQNRLYFVRQAIDPPGDSQFLRGRRALRLAPALNADATRRDIARRRKMSLPRAHEFRPRARGSA